MATESNTYNDYSAATAEEYPLISNFSHWTKPDRARQLYDVNPVEADFMDFMKMGLMRKVMAEEIFHREANSRFEVPTVNSSTTVGNVYGTASTGNNDPAAYDSMDYIQLSAASHTPTSGPYALKYSYPRIGDIIQFTNGAQWRVYGKRTTGYDGAHRLYLQKVLSTDPALSATISQVGSTYGGDSFIIIGNAYEESTLGREEGLVPTHKVFQSYLQRFEEMYEVGSFAENTELYEITWQGKPLTFTYIKGINDMEIRLAAAINTALLLQKKDDGGLTNLDAEKGTAKSLTTTQGYIPTLELNAQQLKYQNPSISLFTQINRFRRSLQQGPNCLLWVGYEFREKIENFVTQMLADGGTVYDRKAVDLNVQQFQKGEFIYNLKTMNGLNHAKFAGAPGFNYPNYFIVAPMIKINGSMSGNAGAGEMLDAVNIIYKDQVGVGARGWYKIWEIGANARTAGGYTKRRNRDIEIEVVCGMQVVGSRQHILGTPL